MEESAEVVLKSRKSVPAAIAMVCTAWANARSKDPSTKVGAAIFDTVSGSLHLGYNGFPKGIADRRHLWEQRDEADITKYDLVVHAEVNAAHKALKAGVDMEKCMLVCTHMPCARCWRDVIASLGIKLVYYIEGAYPSQSKKDIRMGAYFAAHLGTTVLKVPRK